ncbi:MAG: hypothetical protein PHY73_05260 [Candidatus Omnitrophica bacterium]|nr:hypothetical protein [Candidatus Omnitrophota bacterium]
MKVFTKQALDEIKKVHSLSRQYNDKKKKSHETKLLSLMRKHVGEIEDLYQSQDKHFLIETGDLAVLCLEIFLENKISADEVIMQCFDRHQKKLKSLIEKRKNDKS